MTKITSLNDLKNIKDATADLSAARSGDQIKIIVGMGTCGIAAGARDVMDAVISELKRHNMMDKVSVQMTGCIGLCQEEPLLDIIYPGLGRVTYGRVDIANIPRIVEENVVRGVVPEDLALAIAD